MAQMPPPMKAPEAPDYQSDILIARGVTWDRLAPALAAVLAVPSAHIFHDEVPNDSDYGPLFKLGYLVASRIDRGTFEWIVQGAVRPDVVTDLPMQALSATLGVPVCTDRSNSESEPNFVVHTPSTSHPNVSVAEHEDVDEEIYFASKQTEKIGLESFGRG